MQRLRHRADFLAAATGAKVSVTGFLLQALDRREDGPVRVGFTVSRKVGNAVVRNRVRRRLKEVVRLAPAGRMRSGYDYVLIGRNASLDLPFSRLVEDFDRALDRVHAAPRLVKDRPASATRRTGRDPKPTPHAGSKQSRI
jgi:ribonuclease P protein component